MITILGLGSLLSERSSRLTFPRLTNFRLVKVKGFRRVFAHTPSVFVERGVANWETQEMSSLSAEPCEEGEFIATAFEVDGNMDDFREREEEFYLEMVPYQPLDVVESAPSDGHLGMLCTASSDAKYIEQWGDGRFESKYRALGLQTIWNWSTDGNLKPCATYLRHCALAAEKLGPAAHASFLDDTFLVDRTTTIRAYLAANPHVMETLPPESLRERYSG